MVVLAAMIPSDLPNREPCAVCGAKIRLAEWDEVEEEPRCQQCI